MTNNTMTDQGYQASKDPRIAALWQMNLPDGSADVGGRSQAAVALNALGLIIDRQIDLWGWSPSLVMGMRQSDGYVWAPNAFQVNAPSLLDYLDITKAYAGSIKVSTDAADYPPFDAPAPPVVKVSMVGPRVGNVYAYTGPYVNGRPVPNQGDSTTAPDGTTVYFNEGLGPSAMAMPFAEWTLTKVGA